MEAKLGEKMSMIVNSNVDLATALDLKGTRESLDCMLSDPETYVALSVYYDELVNESRGVDLYLKVLKVAARHHDCMHRAILITQW